MSKTFNERINETKAKITQLENHKKQLIQKQKVEERKLRTRRLIERGAIVESMISDAENMTNEEFKTYIMRYLPAKPASENQPIPQREPDSLA